MHTTRVILMTGCASGIARHLTRALSENYLIIATDPNVSPLEECAEQDGWNRQRVKTLRLDVRYSGEWEETVRVALTHFGRLDVLMNVAAYVKPGLAHELEATEVDKHLDINAKGVIHGSRIVGRHFTAQRAGHIINVGSLACLAPSPGLSLYVAAKYAVRGFTLALAQELAPFSVSVSLVMPDAVQAPVLKRDEADGVALRTRLTLSDIERAFVDEVLPNRPLEFALPISRGLIARLASFAPGTLGGLTIAGQRSHS